MVKVSFPVRKLISYFNLFLFCRLLCLCDFHREQAWERWVSATKNGVLHEKEEVLVMLRHMARADSAVKYQEAAKAFRDAKQPGRHGRLMKWFSSHWEPNHKVNISTFCTKRLNSI